MAKSIIPEHPIKKEKFEEIWDFLLEKVFQGKQPKLIKVRDILLSENKRSERKMWFEFSFNLLSPFSSFRFLCYSTVDNLPSKEEFFNRIKEIFDLYDNYGTSRLQKIFSTFPLRDNYRLYFGFEQFKKQSPRRLKIYFDKLFHCYSKRERIEKISKLCRIFNLNHEKVIETTRYLDSDIIVAIDFLPYKENLKIYNRHKKFNVAELRKPFQNKKAREIADIIEAFSLLNKEKSAHFYNLFRFGQNSLQSVKINKVYDFLNIRDINNSSQEIEIFVNRFSKKEKEVWRILQRNLMLKYPFFPAAVGVDYPLNGKKRRIYIYLGLKVNF